MIVIWRQDLSLPSPGCPGTHSATQPCLKLIAILLLQPLQCWDYSGNQHSQLFLFPCVYGPLWFMIMWLCGCVGLWLAQTHPHGGQRKTPSVLYPITLPYSLDTGSLTGLKTREAATSRCNPPSLPCLVLTLQEITGTASSVRACCIWMQFLVCGQQSSNPHSPPSGPSFLSFFLNIFGRVNWDKTIYQGHKISKKHACLSLMLLTPFFFFYNCSLSFTMLSFCSSLVAMKDLL